jgi:ferredoxin-type protein NapH
MGAEQELIDRAVRTEFRTVPYLRNLKYILAIFWVAGAVILAAGARELVVNPQYQIGSGLPPWTAATYGFFYAMTSGVFFLVLVLGRRGMCNYFCPMSVVFMAITAIKDRLRIPSLHLESDQENCIRCKKCTTVCPMSLPVQTMVETQTMQNPECIVCGNCADTCPKDVIHLA